MIRLEKVNEKTFKKVVDMKLSEEQNRFVAPNVVSLAQAWLDYDMARPYAVCDDDEVVGFIMLDWDEGERTAGIWRFMIASEYQNRGYGRRAMELAIEMARDDENIDMMHLDYVKGNTVARELYYSLGFRENGDEEDGEIIMTLPLTDNPKVGMLTADEDDIDDFLELIEDEQNDESDIPEKMKDEQYIREAVEKRNLLRYTIMGDTIGFSIDGQLVIGAKSREYLDEAKALCLSYSHT